MARNVYPAARPASGLLALFLLASGSSALMRSRLCIAVLAVRQCEGFRIPCFFGSTRRQSLLWPACMVDEVPTDGVDALTANP